MFVPLWSFALVKVCSFVTLIAVAAAIQGGGAGGQGVPDGPAGVCEEPAQPAD